MTDGTLLVNGPIEQMNGALDYDGTFEISGGVVVATGSSRMAMAPSSASTQNSLLSTLSTQAAGTVVHIQSTDGDALLTFAPSKQFESIMVSTAELSQDATYEVYVGGATAGADSAGLYDADDYTGGDLVGTTTTAEAVSSSMGGGRRRPGP